MTFRNDDFRVWCPPVTSDQLLSDPSPEFAGDAPVIVSSEEPSLQEKPLPGDTPSPGSAGGLVSAELDEPRAVLKCRWLWRILRVPFWIFCHLWLRLKVFGRSHVDRRRGGLFLINHQSYLDPLVVAVFLGRPVSYVARDNLFKIPVVGWILRQSYVIPISRESARGGAFRSALENLEAGYLVGIFPEGTRSDTDEVHRFRPGFLTLLRRTRQPVYPVGVTGGNRAMPRGAWWIRPYPIRIVIGKPLTESEIAEFRNSTDDARLAEMMRQRVEDCVRQAAAVEYRPEDS